ncbi:MAG: metal-sensing transcriptional repressor [Carboxydocellales bacterium]
MTANDNCCDSIRKSHHTDKTKKDIINRLNRVEGQVRGVKAMVEKDVYCDDILNQIAAVQAALNSTGKLLLEKHVKSCVKERVLAGDDEVLDEVLKTIQKLVR